VIGGLRRALLSAIGRSGQARPLPQPANRSSRRRRSASEADKRIEAARRRLKSTIPPPAE
jgi:hypothetical protein